MPGPTRRWWPWLSNASSFPRSPRRRTTSSWTRSSPSARSIRAKDARLMAAPSQSGHAGHRAEVDDTYAEAFRSIYAECLITARDRIWLDHAVAAATGNASSTILCDCEAGLDRYVGPGGDESFETPDGRPGAVLQFHVPRFHKDRLEKLERSLLVRISQNVLTCPTASAFNLIDSDPYFKLGRKIAFFGDGHQFRDHRYGRKVWVLPIMGGEFIIDRRFGFSDGVMGGNLWFFAESLDASLAAAELGV